MHRSVRSPHASKVHVLAAAAVAVFALAAVASNALGKDKEVLLVEGAVEVLNDLIYEPFLQSVTVSDESSPSADFDIPDGKRLIIETIAFQASRPASESTRLFIHPLVDGQRLLIPLPVQFTEANPGITSAYDISVIPMRLRVDAEPGVDNEVFMRRGFGGAGTLTATISGYLVDL